MAQKISPISYRISYSKHWLSRWFSKKEYPVFLKEDIDVREFLNKKFKNMSVDKIEIERSPDMLSVIIHTARPGLIIGRGGTGVEDLKKIIQKIVKRKTAIRVDIKDYKSPEMSARIMAESIAEQIERRIPFRRILKQTLAKIMNNRDVKGAKIQVSGRLNGAEIARREHLEQGSLPLQTLRANIDFSKVTAHTTYGTIGVKVWIYKGETFETESQN